MKFEACAELANMGAILDVAGEQTSSIKHDSLDDSKTVHALLFTKCEGKALSLVSLVPRRHGLEAWRVPKEELLQHARWEKMNNEGRDLGDMLASYERETLQSIDLPQVQTSSKRSKWRLLWNTHPQLTVIS